MAHQVKDLTSDQLRRIFRDFLIGRPKERLMKKYDISEETFWEIVGMYSKKKHPNDVGAAQDIEGPADLLVTPLDTGSTATEHPIVARNPEDLAVTHEQLVAEYDYNSPAEQLRVKGGEVNDAIRDQAAKTANERRDTAREAIKENKEATDAILTELTETSKSEKAAIAEKAVEGAKAAPSAEEVLKLRNERQENAQRAETAAEAERAKSTTEHAQKMSEEWPKLVEEGKKQNAEALKKETEARQKETDERANDLQEAKSAEQESARREGEALQRPSERGQDRGGPDKVGGQSNLSASSGQGSGDNPKAPANQGNPGAVAPANTSPTAQPNPVEPAKVEPDGLKENK